MTRDTGRDAQEDKQEEQRKAQEQCNAPFLFLFVLRRTPELDSAPAKLATVIGKIAAMECIDRQPMLQCVSGIFMIQGQLLSQ